MRVELNHTIVAATDKRAPAAFAAGILGLDLGAPWGPFPPVALSNGLTLEHLGSDDVHPQRAHGRCEASTAAVGQAEPLGRTRSWRLRYRAARARAAGVPYFADPFLRRTGEINHLDGGRGVYFHDPDGHLLEVVTQPDGPTPGSTK